MKIDYDLLARVEDNLNKGYKLIATPYMGNAWILNDDEVKEYLLIDSGTLLLLIKDNFANTRVYGNTFIIELQKEE